MRYLRRFNESNESSIEILDYISDILTDITDEGIEYDIYTASRKSYHFDGEIASQEWLKEHGINIYDVSQFGQWLSNKSTNMSSISSLIFFNDSWCLLIEACLNVFLSPFDNICFIDSKCFIINSFCKIFQIYHSFLSHLY